MNKGNIAWSLGLAVILLTGTLATVMPVNVSAQQNVTITSSSDVFYGPSLIRFTVSGADFSSDIVDNLNVNIEVKDEAGNIVNSKNNVQLTETGKSSGIYELFIAAHTDAMPQSPSSGAKIVKIYDGATGPDDIDQALKEDYKIKVTYTGGNNPSKEVTYAPSDATVTVDRTTVGNQNKIRVKITDQDANLDPTGIDNFTATNNIIKSTTNNLDLTNMKFKETGSNTGVFELIIGVNNNFGNTAAKLTVNTFPSSDSIIITDHDVYHTDTDTYPDGDGDGNTHDSGDELSNFMKGTAPFDNDPNTAGIQIPTPTVNTIPKSISLKNTDGQITLLAPLTIGNGFQIQITDADRNVDTTVRDTFDANIFGVGTVPFKETEVNSGVFLPDLTNNRVPIQIGGATAFDDNAKVYKVTVQDIADDKDITLKYDDPNGDPQGAESFTIVRKIQHVAGTIETSTPSLPTSGTAIIIIRDNDLNTNSFVADSHSVTLNLQGGKIQSDIADGLGNLKIEVVGKSMNAGGLNLVLSEVDENGNPATNTGIFRGQFDLSDPFFGVNLEDEDKVRVTYTDKTEKPETERSVDIRIGKPSGEVVTDRTTYPPSQRIGNTDYLTKIYVNITDPTFNKNSGSEDQLLLDDNNNQFDEGEVKVQFIKGSTKLDWFPNGDEFPKTASEEGVNTGLFTFEIELPRNVDPGNDSIIDNVNLANPTGTTKTIEDGWQVRIVYKDSNGDERDESVNIRATTADISTDMLTYTLGSTIILTINEPDFNFDMEEKDEISLADLGNLLTVDTDAIGTMKFADLEPNGKVDLDPDNVIRETGPNTGVFEIKLKDIDEDFAERGDRVKFEYEDQTTTGGGRAITIEHTVNIVSGTVEIIFDKDVYTPFEEVCVTIVDPSANTDPDSRDKIGGPKTDNNPGRITVIGVDDEMDLVFEETGPDTGLFMYNGDECIQLGALENGNDKNSKVPADADLIVERDSAIRVEYETQSGDIELTKSALIVFNDGSISFDKSSYKIGDTATVTVVDPDLNRDPDVADQITIDVWSTSDRAGVDVTLTETGKKTGIFTGNVILSTGTSSGNRLHVNEGDTITARYTDRTLPDPADYPAGNDFTRSADTQRLDATATIGISKLPTERAPASEPEFVDESGNPITEITAGQQILISSKVTNNQTISQDFVQIVKVTDEFGNVVMLAFTQGTLNPNEERTNAFSWIPDRPGTYTVEILVWQSFDNPIPLSPKVTTTVEVM